MDNPEPRAQYLNVVLRHIDRTSLRIPRFQRHFVWTERNVLDLLGSIEQGFPIGSILTWKVDRESNYFAGYREGPFPASDPAVLSFEVILDGAQRLSSLYGCLRKPGEDPVYNVVYDARAREFIHREDVTDLGSWHVPMDSLFDSRRFLEVQGAIAALSDGEECLQHALALYSTFQDYQIPIIALASESLDEVVEVFRRVNSSGTPLSSVDFVRALTWKSSFDLEETFEAFAERYQGSPLEGLTEDFLVRCLAISARLSLDTREILQLRTLARRDGALGGELAAMERALDRMAQFLERLDIVAMREVPYDVQRLLLFGLMYYDAEISAEELEAWFWRSTFAEEHQSKPESYVSRLIREMRAGNPRAALEVKKPVDGELLATRVRRGGTAVAVGFDLLLRKCHARSLLSGNPVAGSDVLHATLYPKAELGPSSGGIGSGPRSLANLALLTPEDAKTWAPLRRHQSLDELFDKCERQTGEAAGIWATQGLEPPAGLAGDEVLRRRSRSLLNRVVRLDS